MPALVLVDAPLSYANTISSHPRCPSCHAINLVKLMLDVQSSCLAPENSGCLGALGSTSDSELQRAHGTGEIVLAGFDNRTRIVDMFQRSPLRVMFPRGRGASICESVFVNMAGGVAGGDRLDCGVTALAGASIAVTSQAAEKVYRALNEPAQISTRLTACEAAKLAWLPQETIFFNCARLCRQTEIDLASGAQLLALESLVLGRVAHGEEVASGYISDSWRVRQDGRLIWADTFRATDETFSQLHRNALLSDCRAIGTLVYFGPDLDARLSSLRDIAHSLASECRCAATSVGGLIVVRFAAKLSSDLRDALMHLLGRFGEELGPGPFGVPKMWSC